MHYAVLCVIVFFPHITRAELSLFRWSTKGGDPASVPAATCWGRFAAGMRSRGTADSSIPVAQKWSPNSECHKEETHGERIWEDFFSFSACVCVLRH